MGQCGVGWRYAAFVLAALLALTGCDLNSSDAQSPAYVAPAQLNLRREISANSASSVVLKHGDRVNILDVKRKYVLIRAASGSQGWVDSAQLLSEEQMKTLREATRRASTMPSAGKATVYEALNIHIAPQRQSPSLAQIAEAEPVDVLSHTLAARDNAPAKNDELLKSRPVPAPRHNRGHTTRSSRLPPLPAPPKAPANWQELSAERVGAESIAQAKAHRDSDAANRKAEEARKPVVSEDWSLVRTRSGQIGWVLSRNLVMSIPDEVAQYAGGRRITSYFDLGAVQDVEKGEKHNWLWTTNGVGSPYDFEAWRVFLWNKRKHRYETSYRQRDVEGYLPVIVDPRDQAVFGRTFHIVTKDDDGKFKRRDYVFDGTLVHLTGTQDYNPKSTDAKTESGVDADKLKSKMPPPNWFARQWGRLRESFGGT